MKRPGNIMEKIMTKLPDWFMQSLQESEEGLKNHIKFNEKQIHENTESLNEKRKQLEELQEVKKQLLVYFSNSKE